MAEKETKCCCCNRKKERSEKEYKDLINRLSRIEGQIRGIKRMLDEDCYCPDIITQVAAANAALNSFNKVLLANHIKTCVADDIRAGKDETIDELLNTLQKLMKMSTLITILIISIIAALLIVGLKETIKHSKGEGACCGGGAMKEDEEATVQLTGKIVTRADVHIDGMHCMNCKNSVTRSLQKMSGVSAAVDLKHGVAHVEATRELSDEEITFAIERLDFKVTGIERF